MRLDEVCDIGWHRQLVLIADHIQRVDEIDGHSDRLIAVMRKIHLNPYFDRLKV
jgi:hypothetical protein